VPLANIFPASEFLKLSKPGVPYGVALDVF
jgi:hypothetical protein